MAKGARLLFGGIIGAMILGPALWLLSGDLVVSLVAAGRVVGKVGWILIVVVVGAVWLYVALRNSGRLK